MKLFINALDDITSIIPNRDRVLKDKIYNTSYDILYYLNLANYSNNKEYVRREISNSINNNVKLIKETNKKLVENRVENDNLKKELDNICKM